MASNAPVPDALSVASRHLRDGRHHAAARALLPVLLDRAAEGDQACAVAAALLQGGELATVTPPTEDRMAEAVAALVRLLDAQDAQVARLLDLLDAP